MRSFRSAWLPLPVARRSQAGHVRVETSVWAAARVLATAVRALPSLAKGLPVRARSTSRRRRHYRSTRWARRWRAGRRGSGAPGPRRSRHEKDHENFCTAGGI